MTTAHTFTDAEVKVLARLAQRLAEYDREDIMGAILKATGHTILDGKGIVDLATKLEAHLPDPLRSVT